jgi:TRAP-type mannitol/chloroaromatic compound transport system substrate-binding protein
LALAAVDGSLVAPSPEELSAQMDAINLEQALIDVEVANARVLDLTARLVESSARVSQLHDELTKLRAESEIVAVAAETQVAELRAEMAAHDEYLAQQRSSHAFRWAAKVWNLRNALKS